MNNNETQWFLYPIGTKVFSVFGGHWTKVNAGWQWLNGDVFPQPTANYNKIEVPATI